MSRSVRQLRSVCRYYRRALDHSPAREHCTIATVLIAGAWVFSIWMSRVGGHSLPLVRTVALSLGVSFVGVGFVFLLRRTMDATSTYNLSVAIAAWQSGDRDHAFLVLFDPVRPLSPTVVKSPMVQRLLRSALSCALAKTAVVEVRTNPDIVRLMARLPEEEVIFSEAESREVRVTGEKGQSVLHAVLITAVIANVLLALVKLLSR